MILFLLSAAALSDFPSIESEGSEGIKQVNFYQPLKEGPEARVLVVSQTTTQDFSDAEAQRQRLEDKMLELAIAVSQKMNKAEESLRQDEEALFQKKIEEAIKQSLVVSPIQNSKIAHELWKLAGLMLTDEAYRETLQRVKDGLTNKAEISSQDKLFLAVWECVTSDRPYRILSNNQLIVNASSDGNCFWYSIFSQNPELAVKLGLSVDEVIGYLSHPTFRDDPVAQVFIQKVKSGFMALVSTLDLDSVLVNIQNFSGGMYNPIVRSIYQLIYDAMVDSKQRELRGLTLQSRIDEVRARLPKKDSSEGATDKELKEAIAYLIEMPLVYAEEQVSYFLAELFNYNIKVLSNGRLSTIKTHQPNGEVFLFYEKEHYQRVYTLPAP